MRKSPPGVAGWPALCRRRGGPTPTGLPPNAPEPTSPEVRRRLRPAPALARAANRVRNERTSWVFLHPRGLRLHQLDPFALPQVSRILLVVCVVPVLVNAQARYRLVVLVGIVHRSGRRLLGQGCLVQIVLRPAAARVGPRLIADEVQPHRVDGHRVDRKSTRLNSSHLGISY